MKISKMMEMGKDYAPEAMKMAKDYAPKVAHAAKEHMPSKHDVAKAKMKTDAHLIKGVSKAMPAKVKKMELAKVLILPAVGAAAALLFAPKSGKDLRVSIKRGFVKAKDRGKDRAMNVMDKAKEVHEDMMPEGDTLDSVVDIDLDTRASYTGDIPDASADPAAGVGNVHGTPYEPDENQTVPADKLDEALEDVGVSSEEQLVNDEKDRM